MDQTLERLAHFGPRAPPLRPVRQRVGVCFLRPLQALLCARDPILLLPHPSEVDPCTMPPQSKPGR